MKTSLRFAILSAVGLLAVWAMADQRPVELMRNAVFVAKSPHDHRLKGEHYWLSSRELLAVVQTTEMVEEGAYYGFPYRLLRMRTDSRNHNFVHLPKKLERDGCDWAFSPDGTRILCETVNYNSTRSKIDGYSYYLCSLDGAARLVHNEASDGIPSSPMAWLADGLRWVDTSDWEGNVRIRDLDRAPISKRIPEFAFHSDLLISEHPAVQLRGHIGSKVVDSITCGIWNPDSGRSQQRKIPTPIKGEVVDVALSRNGQSLGWIIWVRDRSWVKSQIRRIPLLESIKPVTDSFQLWVTDLRGSGATRVGIKQIVAKWDSTPSCFAPGWRFDGGFYNLEWLPDSRSASFTLDDSIYVVRI